MEEKDRGRAFLFSKYYGFIDNEDEDGDYQIYSDGSGYYHGSDGSEGHIYSDGTGRFRGADGSTGHRNSDGSGYRSRIRIVTLLGLSFASGSVGGLISMYLFRHKTQKDYFTVGMPLIIVTQIVVLFYVMNAGWYS